MRSFQVLRYNGRRTTITNNELASSMKNSSSFTSFLKCRNSMSLLSDEQPSNVQTAKDKRKLFGYRKITTKSMDSTTVNKRNTLVPNSDHSSRRSSFQQQDLIELTKPKTNLRNFYIFFLILFLFLFISLVYSFIRMIKNSN